MSVCIAAASARVQISFRLIQNVRGCSNSLDWALRFARQVLGLVVAIKLRATISDTLPWSLLFICASMGETNDDATNALIASMLAEDNHYTEYDSYNVGVDSEDDDWGGGKRKPKKGQHDFPQFMLLRLVTVQAHHMSALYSLIQLL